MAVCCVWKCREVQRVCKFIRPGEWCAHPACSLCYGVFFKLTHKLADPVDPRFTLAQILHKFQSGWAVQTEVLRLFLQ